MDRRTWLRGAMATTGAAILPARPAAAAAGMAEMRGLWVVRTAMTSPAAIDDAVARAGSAGLNAVFAQVRGRGDAFYASRLVPRSILLERQPSSFDPLAHALGSAHARGVQVHAWFNLMIAAGLEGPLPAGHVVRQHPEWLMVPRGVAAAASRLSGRALADLVVRGSRATEAEGLFLSPYARGACDHLEAAVRELVRGYPLAGIHFDFVRFPGREFDHSRAAGGGRSDGEHRDALSALVLRLAGAARRERPGMVVSAAVVPDVVMATQHRFQDWPRWASTGVLDAVCPMAYAPERDVYAAQLASARGLVGAQRIWAGIGAWRLDDAETVRRAHVAREKGLGGFVLFSHEWLAGRDPARLRPGLDPAAGPVA
jgi:uncharacterized lipoprotein YddW (UPF0748 family)